MRAVGARAVSPSLRASVRAQSDSEPLSAGRVLSRVRVALMRMASAFPGAGPGAPEGQRLSHGLLALTLLAVASSSFSALSLYHTLALKAEVASLHTEVLRRREEQHSAPPVLSRDGGEGLDSAGEADSGLGEIPANPQRGTLAVQKRSAEQEAVTTVLQPCLQLMANGKRSLTQKVFVSDVHTVIPWQTGLKRGSALEQDGDTILVNEEGFYLVYGQVYYMDKTFAMGHIIVRRKKDVVGDELREVTLFRCIQNMDLQFPYNTCYTAGVVKLEAGDRVELLIPRKTADISFDGDSTFFGAVKLV
ncbi:hypothetical protein SKAU_G00259080 [Synaphobranchus kaupii]|uniref:THD domain-containing protein n=1 Tax=Synaphobranchus kaupii TaxID=118154 RepID=A0A9Q1F4D0_SYNKA|nr:hypothetical protein SKAU_G00259080 [Synaphobranchus kaupii]